MMSFFQRIKSPHLTLVSSEKKTRNIEQRVIKIKVPTGKGRGPKGS